MEKSRQLTLIAFLAGMPRERRELPAGYEVKKMSDRDKLGLAELFLASYPRDVVKNLDESQDEMKVTFDGVYGPLDFDSSLMITRGEVPVASIMIVKEAPWDDTPPGPFIIELMVHPDHRRLGLAEHLLLEAVSVLEAAEKKTAALRVLSDNEKALPLYRRLGFVDQERPEHDDSRGSPA